jgi:hypothetical protein
LGRTLTIIDSGKGELQPSEKNGKYYPQGGDLAFFTDLLSPPPTFVNVFPISLGKKCPVSHSSQW